MGFFVSRMKDENKDLPIFLIAHSMGGALALSFINTVENSPITGVIALSPLLRLTPNVYNDGLMLILPYLKRIQQFGRLFNARLPELIFRNRSDGTVIIVGTRFDSWS